MALKEWPITTISIGFGGMVNGQPLWRNQDHDPRVNVWSSIAHVEGGTTHNPRGTFQIRARCEMQRRSWWFPLSHPQSMRITSLAFCCFGFPSCSFSTYNRLAFRRRSKSARAVRTKLSLFKIDHVWCCLSVSDERWSTQKGTQEPTRFQLPGSCPLECKDTQGSTFRLFQFRLKRRASPFGGTGPPLGLSLP